MTDAPIEPVDPDAALMVAVQEGDVAAFEQLLTKHRRAIVNFIYRIVNNSAVAEELAQDVFLKVYKARGSYEPRARFTSWLYRIATNVSLKALEKNRRAPFSWWRPGAESQAVAAWERVPDPAPDAEHEVLRAERGAIVRSAVQSLPRKEKVAVVLRRYQGLSYKEIAEVMGCTEAAVKTYIHRGKLHLRDRLMPFIREGRL